MTAMRKKPTIHRPVEAKPSCTSLLASVHPLERITLKASTESVCGRKVVAVYSRLLIRLSGHISPFSQKEGIKEPITTMAAVTSSGKSEATAKPYIVPQKPWRSISPRRR